MRLLLPFLFGSLLLALGTFAAPSPKVPNGRWSFKDKHHPVRRQATTPEQEDPPTEQTPTQGAPAIDNPAPPTGAAALKAVKTNIWAPLTKAEAVSSR